MVNGYIQVEILGRKRGLKFGMLAVQQITLEAQKLGVTLGVNIDIALVPVIVYWGLFNNCYVKREDPDFTFEDICDYVDDNVSNVDTFKSIIECFYQSRLISSNVTSEDKSADDEKKSST